MAVCRLRLAQGSVKYGGHLIDFRGGSRPPGPPQDPSRSQNENKCMFDKNLVGTKGGQIWTPTLEFLQNYIFFKNDPPPLGTLKYLQKANLIFFKDF